MLILSSYLLPFAMPGKPLDPPPLGFFIDLGDHLLRSSRRTRSFSSVLATLGAFQVDSAALTREPHGFMSIDRLSVFKRCGYQPQSQKIHGFSVEQMLHIKSFCSMGGPSSDGFIVMFFFSSHFWVRILF